MEKLSQSLEDYLEAIVSIGGTTAQSVKPSDIARKMGVSKTSVGKALRALRTRGLIEQPYYGEATLTEDGYAYGASMLERHHYLAAFLAKAVGLSQEAAEAEAGLMKHAVGDESFAKWADYIEGLGILDA